MPGAMNLRGEVTVGNVRLSDDLFSIHGLAVIRVHDAQEEQKMTLSVIADADEHLCFTKGTLLYSFLLTFGRQATPVFIRVLKGKFKMSDTDIEQKVEAIVPKLAKAAEQRYISLNNNATP